MAELDLQGRTALVTGSTSGIGAEIARLLATRGAEVLVTGRDAARGESVVAGIRRTGGLAEFIAADLSGADTVRRFAQQVSNAHTRIDILVNNAGIFPNTPPGEPVSEEAFDGLFAINVKAPFYLVEAFAPAMVAAGRGSIVNVTTMAANVGVVGLGLYGASKAALQLLTKAWAAEFGSAGVRVNTVSPGPTLTEGTSGSLDLLRAAAAAAPSQQVGEPGDVAEAVAFLVSDAAKHIYGAVLPVDGGRIAV